MTSNTNLECPDCGSEDTYRDSDHRLHCFSCGQINDAFVLQWDGMEPEMM